MKKATPKVGDKVWVIRWNNGTREPEYTTVAEAHPYPDGGGYVRTQRFTGGLAGFPKIHQGSYGWGELYPTEVAVKLAIAKLEYHEAMQHLADHQEDARRCTASLRAKAQVARRKVITLTAKRLKKSKEKAR